MRVPQLPPCHITVLLTNLTVPEVQPQDLFFDDCVVLVHTNGYECFRTSALSLESMSALRTAWMAACLRMVLRKKKIFLFIKNFLCKCIHTTFKFFPMSCDAEHWLVKALLEAMGKIALFMEEAIAPTIPLSAIDFDGLRTRLRRYCCALRDFLNFEDVNMPMVIAAFNRAAPSKSWPALFRLACFLCNCPPDTSKWVVTEKLRNAPVPYLDLVIQSVVLHLHPDLLASIGTDSELRKMGKETAAILTSIFDGSELFHAIANSVMRGLPTKGVSLAVQMQRGVYVKSLMQDSVTDYDTRWLAVLQSQPFVREMDMTLGVVIAVSNYNKRFVNFPALNMLAAVAIMTESRTALRNRPDGCHGLRRHAFVESVLESVRIFEEVPVIIELARTTRFAVACVQLPGLDEEHKTFVADHLLDWLIEEADHQVVLTCGVGVYRGAAERKLAWSRWSALRRAWVGGVVRAACWI